MGAGKSSVGRELAQRLEVPFVDTDEEIERAAGKSVSEIFASEGEAAFRKREEEVIAGQVEARAVVALGGGALGHPDSLHQVMEHGWCAYLRTSIPWILRRIGDDVTRPLLSGLDPEERRARLQTLQRERVVAYDMASGGTEILTDRLSVAEVADEVLAHYRGER